MHYINNQVYFKNQVPFITGYITTTSAGCYPTAGE